MSGTVSNCVHLGSAWASAGRPTERLFEKGVILANSDELPKVKYSGITQNDGVEPAGLGHSLAQDVGSLALRLRPDTHPECPLTPL